MTNHKKAIPFTCHSDAWPSSQTNEQKHKYIFTLLLIPSQYIRSAAYTVALWQCPNVMAWQDDGDGSGGIFGDVPINERMANVGY